MTPEIDPARALVEDKRAWRRRFRAQAQEVTSAERAAASERAGARLRQQPEWQQATCILLYAALDDELDLRPVVWEALGRGVRVALPRFDAQRGEYEAARVADWAAEVAPGHRGIEEPRPSCPTIPLKALDLALVPGLGFDVAGRRLGRGKGYYDRLLASVTGLRCGVAMDWQIVPRLPAGPHDQTLDCLLTPTRWLACRPRAV